MEQQAHKTIRILVADDHPMVRAGIASIFEETHDLSVVAQVPGVETAVAAWQEHQPDVGLFDLRMADGDAVGAITRIRQFDPDARILVMSSYDSDEEVYRVIKAGARGYMLKDDEPEAIVGAIHRVLSGQTYLAPNIAGKLATRIGEDDLSEREVQILSLVSAGRSNAAIAKELNISTSTIKFHLRNVYSKLGVSSRTKAVAIAVKRGIIAMQ